MFKLLKGADVCAPESLGKKDVLICGEKIALIDDNISINIPGVEVIDAAGKTLTPGLIDQHVHITGAGGKHGFHSLTPEIMLSELISCGTTTVMGLLGTDGATKSLKALYAKTKSLDNEGITAYMLTSYFGIPPITITGTVLEDMILIDKVLGCKVAISDERSSFPTAKELLAILKDVHVGGLTSGKGGIMHIHLGALPTNMGLLLELVEQYHFPIKNISPTHVGRTAPLFEEAIRFAKLGGMIDITTGGTKFDEPYKQVLYALEKGVPMDNMTFSSDGNAGIGLKDKNGNPAGFKKAPIDLNLKQVQKLVREANMPVENAIKLITSGPARNLSLKHKGHIRAGYDADICLFDEDFELTDVFARGKIMMQDKQVLVYGSFEIKPV
jgi:beta-aspartyl-dipeptidase (metallo-type)